MEQSVVNHLSKIVGNILLKCLLSRSTFSSWILSSNLYKFCFLNRGLKWKSLDWKLIVLSAFFSRIDTIDSTEILHPNHIGIINMWVKDCIIYGFRSVDIDKIPDLKRESIFSIQFYCNIRNMVFAVQIFINPNVKIFNRICGIESLSI